MSDLDALIRIYESGMVIDNIQEELQENFHDCHFFAEFSEFPNEIKLRQDIFIVAQKCLQIFLSRYYVKPQFSMTYNVTSYPENMITEASVYFVGNILHEENGFFRGDYSIGVTSSKGNHIFICKGEFSKDIISQLL